MIEDDSIIHIVSEFIHGTLSHHMSTIFNKNCVHIAKAIKHTSITPAILPAQIDEIAILPVELRSRLVSGEDYPSCMLK